MNPHQIKFESISPEPPSNLYVDAPGGVIWSVWNSATGVTLTLTIRMIDENGSVQESMYFTMSPTSDRALNTKNMSIGGGYILSAMVSVTGGTVNSRGQCWTTLQLADARANPTFIPIQTFLSDYVTNGSNPSWPGGFIRQSTEGAGYINIINVSNPAAGVDWTYTVPAHCLQSIKGIFAFFQTSAAVGNRVMQFQLNSPYDAISSTSNNVAASTQAHFIAEPWGWNPSPAALVFENVQQEYLSMIFPLFLIPGDTLISNTNNIAAADQWTHIIIHTEDWIFI